MYSKSLIAAIMMMAAVFVSAQVEVEDRSPVPVANMPPPSQQTPPMPAQSVDLYYQLQVLQQEVLQLRGMVEEQAHELKRLKQQRLDDYLELDRRLSGSGQSGLSQNQSSSGTSSVSGKTVVAGSGAVAPQDEIQDYRKAIDLVLKKQQYDDAIVALQEHLNKFPNGRYSANAVYWLGEIFLLKNDPEKARQWFTQLLTDYPRHRKVPDGKFKLGKVYHLLGDVAQAKKLLNEVAATNTDAAPLARDYLRDNLQ